MSSNQNKVNVVVTGTEWMGGGVGSIETVIADLFKTAKSELCISAYAIGNSSDLIFEWLENALQRGIKVKMLINRLDEQPIEVRGRLRNFLIIYPHFTLYEFKSAEGIDLHAKIIAVDRRKALVGSSNLSRRGLISNFEMGLLVEGSVAGTITNTLDKLIVKSLKIVVSDLRV